MRSSILSGLVLVVAPIFVAEQGALANPLGGVVAAGTATISQTGNALTVNQTSGHAIINWGSFNIAAGESASFHFLGPAGANSAVLNEVSGSAGPSFLNGLLNSYVGPGNHVGGTVYIYNPNGLLIGPQGFINVGSFIGTSLALSDASFMKGGALTLGGPTVTGGSSIQNEGQISALDGDIFLIAHNVVNSGALTANHVGLAAGSYVEIKQPGERGAEHLSILAGDSSQPGGTGVNNTASGLIKAVTTQLQAAGGNVYALAVNNSGMIHADTVVSHGGKIYLTGNGGLVQNSGTLDASDTAAGGKGGTVEVTGSQVTLTGSSAIKADGDAGGGTVLIGGGSMKTAAAPMAAGATVQAGATITANAITKGDGGQVTVLSGGDTIFDGQISALGGAKGGLGGSAEVSGQNLSITGHADLLAPNGKAGTLLLDPGSVTIQGGPNTGPSATMNVFNDAWINAQLANASLTIDTANSTDNLSQNLSVLASAAISWNSANNLVLNGANLVSISGTITGMGTGGLTLSSSMGNILVNNTGSISVGGAVSMTALTGMTFDGSVTLTGTQGLSLNNGGLVSGPATLTANSLVLAGAGNLGAAGAGNAINTDVNNILFQNNSGNVWLNNGGNAVGLSGTTLGGNVTLTAGTTVFGATSLAGNLALTTSGAVSQIGGTALSVAGTSTFNAGANAITLNNTGNDLAGTVTVGTTGANDVFLNNGNNALTVFADVGRNLTATTTGSLTLDGTVGGNLIATGAGISDGGNVLTIGGTTSLTAGAGNPITFDAPGDSFAGAVTINSGNNVLLIDALPLSLSGTISGNLNASASGIDINGALTVNGPLGASLNADPNNLGNTTLDALTIAAPLKVTAANAPLNLTAAGINLTAGSIQTAGLITLTASDQGAIGLGTAAGDLTLTGPELANISTSGGLTLNTTGGSEVSVSGVTAANSMNIAGTVTMNAPGGAVSFVSAPSSFNSLVVNAGRIDLNANVTTTTAAGQAYNGAVTVTSPNVALTATGGGGVSFSSTIDSATGAESLDVEASGAATFGGLIGHATPLNNFTVDGTLAGTTIALNAGGVTTGGSQSYGAFGAGTPLTLGAATTLASTGGGNINLASTVNGSQALDVETTGATTFGGAVGGITKLASLTVDGTDSGTIDLNGGAVTTTGAQTYGVVTGTTLALGAPTTILTGSSLSLETVTGNGLTLVNSGPATLSGAVNLSGGLTASGSGALVVDNTISVTTLSDGEATTLNGIGGSETMTTTGDQAYMKTVTLGANTTLNSGTTLELAAVNMGGDNLSILNGGVATLSGAVNGTGVLTVSGAGSLAVDGTIAAGSVSDSEATTLSGGTVTTTGGDQKYTGAMTLGADTTLYSGTIELAGVTGAGYNLTLNNTGLAQLNGIVAGVNDLNANDLGGTLDINTASISTLTDQNYKEPVSLGTPAVTLSSQTIELAAIAGNGDFLTLNNTGVATLNGAITGLETLTASGSGSLAVDNTISAFSLTDGEATAFNGGSVTTILGQSYTAAVTLGASTTLASTGGGNILLGSTVNGAQALDVETAGKTTFGGIVGGITKLASLTVDASDTAGSIALNGGAVTTTSGQTYDAPVTLGANTALKDSGIGSIIFAPTATITGSAGSLTVATTGATATTFGAAVATRSLMVDQSDTSGIINLNGGAVTTTAGQTYDAAVTLGANTVLKDTLGGQIVFGLNVSVTGPAWTLDVETTGATATSFSSSIATRSLTVDQNNASGLINMSAGQVTTTAGQTYDAELTLLANTVFTDTGAGKITFGPSAAISGSAFTLDVETTGATMTTFGAPVTIKSLTVDASDALGLGLIALNGGSVTTTAGQTYDGPLTLGANTVLKDTVGGKITFGPTATVTGLGESLDVETVGTTTFGGAVNVAGLTVDQNAPNGSINLNGGTVTTTAGQIYDGAVTLGANTVLKDTGAGAITFGANATIGGAAENLDVETAGTTTFHGAINVKSLTVDQSDTGGTIGLDGTTVTTSAGQTYDAAATLGARTLLVDNSSSAISFGPAAAITGAQSLEVETGGLTTFGASVNVKSLTADQTDTAGKINLNGGTVTTSAGQIYDGAVTLGAGTLLSDTGGSAISFGTSAAINGAQTLEVETAGTTTFGGAVNVKSLTVDQTVTGGAISLNGGAVTTSAGQIYDGAVSLSAGTLLSDTGNSAITFGPSATINGAQSLEVETGGTLTFGGAVNVQSLIADQTSTGGTIDLNAGSVTTVFGQTYGAPVTLGANTTLTGTTLSLKAVNMGADSLTLINSGLATFNGAVNGTGALTASGTGTLTLDGALTVASFSDGEPTTLSGGTITTTSGDQDYTGTLTLVADTTLTGGTIELAGVAGDGYNLTLNNSGLAQLNGTVAGLGSLTAINATGSLAINTASVSAAVDQDYGETVSLGAAAVTLNSGTIELASVTGAGNSLTLNNTGLATLNKAESGLGTFSATGIGTLMVDSTISGAAVSDNEATTLGGGSVTTTGGQTYASPITLTSATTLSSTGSGNITLGSTVNGAQTLDVETGGTTTLGGAVNVKSLTADQTVTGGTIYLNGGAVTTTAGQTYDGAVTLGESTVLKDTGTGAISFGPTASITGSAATLDVETTGATAATFGGTVGVQSLTVDASDTAGLISLNGGAVTTAAGQTYDGAVTLGANTILKDTGIGPITFGPSATVTGSAKTLDVETTGTTAATFGGAVIVQSLKVDSLDSSGLIALNGGAVTTTAGQTYDGAVTLGANTVIKDTGTGSITFGPSATVTGTAHTLDIETTGATTTTLGAAVTTRSLTVDANDSAGLIGLNAGAVTTSAGQTYDGAVTLSQNTALKDTGTGSITFGPSATITGTAETLDVETTGATSATFGAAVATRSLTVDASDSAGLIGLNGGTVTTTAGQTYNGAVTLGQNTVLKDTGAGSIAFGTSATVTGTAETLDVETTGATAATFGGAVSVRSLTVDGGDSSGLIGLNGGAVTTSAGQTYGGAVSLGANTLLKDSGSGAITFGPTAKIGGASETLEVETAGTTTFEGAVAVKSLTVDQSDTSGTIDLNGGSVTTSGGQIYDGAVTLSSGALLTDTGNSAITFGPLAAISGAQSLEVETGGNLTFGAAVNVKSLMADQTDPTGTIALNSGAVTTTAGQTYDGAVSLGLNTLLKDTGAGAIAFGPTASITGTSVTLNVETTGATAATFGGPVSVQSLTAQANDIAGLVNLNGGAVTTTAGQTYGGAVTLGQNTVLKDTGAGSISFGPSASITGTAETLDVETKGATAATFGGPVSVASLTVEAGDPTGAINLNGGAVTTSAGQTYDGAVTLGQNTILKDTGAGAISFGPSASITGTTETLDVETTGATTATFDAAVAVKSLTVDAGDSSGLIGLNGGAVTTTAGQTYDGAMTLGASTVLQDTGTGAISFGPGASINGTTFTLDVETKGATAATFGGAVNVQSLKVEANDPAGLIHLNGGAVTTSAGQTYDGAVTLGKTTVLTDTGSVGTTPGNTYKAIIFASTIDGAQALTVGAAGTITFLGQVGGKSALSSLYVNYSGNNNLETTGAIDINGGLVKTTSSQTYIGTVDLSADTLFSSGSTVALATVMGNGHNLILNPGELEGTGPNGSGTILFNNTGSGTVNLVSATENPNITSITFFNPAQAFQPGVNDISVFGLIDELLDDEGGGIRSAFDLSKKTVPRSKLVKATYTPQGETAPGSHLLRSSQVYEELGISP